jgi:hypothetical protein
MRSGDMFDKMTNATRSAFDRAGSVTGGENDPDLSLYQSLAPQDFTALMKEYGEEDILRYIRTMESKKLGVKQNGS